MIALDGGFFDGAVHAFDLTVRPWVLHLGESVLDAILLAAHGKHVRHIARRRPIGISRREGELDAAVSEHGVNLVGNSFDQGREECRRGIPAMGCARRACRVSLNRSTRRSPTAWAWASRSAARSSRPMVGGCGRPSASRGVLSFSLRSPLTEPPSVIDVAYWHKTDLPRYPQFGRYRGKADMAVTRADFRV